EDEAAAETRLDPAQAPAATTAAATATAATAGASPEGRDQQGSGGPDAPGTREQGEGKLEEAAEEAARAEPRREGLVIATITSREAGAAQTVRRRDRTTRAWSWAIASLA